MRNEIELIDIMEKVFGSLKLSGCTVYLNNRKVLAGLAEALDVLAEALECDAGDLVKGIQTVAGRPRPKRT